MEENKTETWVERAPVKEIQNYIRTRMSIPFVNFGKIVLSKNDKNSVFMESEDFKSEELGITKFMIKRMWLIVRMHYDEKNNCLIVGPDFCYEHHGGGSNGCDANFKLIYYFNSKNLIEKS